ncbi:hypothetical protein TIFTF001_004297 [Ficus carica]|uniref:Ethylene insensitive 3-like DNA-binding domain-containing protein n=1 Tax=Ficus carica TaxID=3494 RepID=A0AA87ZXC1_FICCA|nr:hypothetical protein TIFTF001_004297 [Ficus carica]
MVKFLEEVDSRIPREILEPKTKEEEEDDDGDADISYDELKKGMWRDRMLMRKLYKDKSSDDHDHDGDQQPDQSSLSSSSSAREEASRRKKMARAQDAILKYMVKIMEVCIAKGFVYGIIPEKGKPVTGSSDSLREWWKEKVRSHGGEMRKFDFDSSEQMVPSTLLYACQNSLCSQNETGLGFVDKSSRKEHEMSRRCAYRSEETGASSTSTSTCVYGPDRSSSVDGNAQVLSVADWLDMEREEGSFNSEAHNFDFVTTLGDFGSCWDELISKDNNLAGPGEEFGVHMKNMSSSDKIPHIDQEGTSSISIWDLKYE